MKRRGNSELTGILFLVLIILFVIGVIVLGFPLFRVYAQTMRGKAALREAEWSRRIAVEEAKALMDSADLKAQAEIRRAQGVAEANQIISDGLGGPEGYLRYLWIQGLQDGSSEVIYVPTEAGLPILEAGARIAGREAPPAEE